MAAAYKAKQDEIRRLMKERRENLKDAKNRIESPFAKYPFIKSQKFAAKISFCVMYYLCCLNKFLNLTPIFKIDRFVYFQFYAIVLIVF